MEGPALDPVSRAATQAAAASARGAHARSVVGKDDFLKLLVAKLEHQDPLSPASDTEFLAELATFSSLEQLMEANESLLGIAMGQADLVNAQALNLIGKHALVAVDGTIKIRHGATDRIVYSLSAPAREATLTVYGPDGTPVRIFALDPSATGRLVLEWDGTDAEGRPLPDGDYRVEARAIGADGEPVAVALFQALSIDGVSFDGGLSLVSGDRALAFDRIVEIRGGF